MKKIGFIDYYLDEWHANNYPAWIKEASDGEMEVAYAWGKIPSPHSGMTSREWCEKYGVQKCETLKELCEKCDYIIVLAPSNPETHLRYAQEVLTYGKNTFIDKTFAPDYQTAKEIFDIAKKNNTKFFSTSALRYATELDAMMDSRSVITTGGGSNIDEYIIHQAEMVVKVLNAKVQKVRVEKLSETQYVSTVVFDGGKMATLAFAPCYPFNVCVETAQGKSMQKGTTSEFFPILMLEILKFFVTGELPFDTNQTLEIMKLREAIITAKTDPEKWFKI